MDITEKLRLRADEIEGFHKDPEALPPSGNDTYTAKLLREAAIEIESLNSSVLDLPDFYQ